ncbi:TetR/AcrR family transcriptional regulator [Aeromicrobium sp. YIM 150415]|uniref:TetR/AcrR family transcriptional regulator n=1 Tax=Aeromicrobium sp. YIM 150415 TaxID=2803912 RepID=UPI001962FA6E|nr:TetR/AcrR family transcriptional regulator [Aeromicrobium sp. YIM 150415]MBM9462110.1 TetR/AcrR family transcriptional regulator [Aeromicrobium sp. YIM 150415]
MAYVEASVRRRQLVAAARNVLSREGVSNTPLRAVALEGNVPLGTLQYVFPTREQLLHAVIEDVVTEIVRVQNESVETASGLAHAIRHGLRHFWARLVADRDLQVMQYELTTYSLRNREHEEDLARWQYESYADVTSRWCQMAAERAQETCAVPFDQLGRIILASVDGLILQFLCHPDSERAESDLERVIDMLIGLASPQKA